MQKFEEKKFNIGELKGISQKNIEEHLKLYSGYVKHANLIMEHGLELSKEPEKYAYELAELQRRFAFEWAGIRNHEIYFAQLEDGPKSPNQESELYKRIIEQWDTIDIFITRMKMTAMTRGVGWAMLYYDPSRDLLLPGWVDEQHLGQLADCRIVLAIDMWEHSFVYDYQPSGKKQYIEDFFENLNWSKVEENFKKAQ
jgi:Fe-Mn family superoxide dismutase